MRDITPGTGSSSPANLAKVGNRVFFSTSDPGQELLMTNGTTAGTTLVTDIYLPQGDSNPTMFRQASNAVVFAAIDPAASGAELWGSDGTVAGTLPLDLGPGSSAPQDLVTLGSLVYAGASVPGLGPELVVTDGSQAGTHLAVDVRPGSYGSSPAGLAVLQGRLWFSASETATGSEAYVSDGTAAGTLRLADIFPGTAGSSPHDFATAGSQVVFGAYSSATVGDEPWGSNGMLGGTSLLLDIHTGASYSSPGPFLSVGNLTYFSAIAPAIGRELWVTNGTTVGTQLVSDIRPGAGSSSPSQLTVLTNGTLIFVAQDSAAGIEPFRSNGTAAGTAMIGQVVAGSSSGSIQDLIAVGNRAFFTADDGVTGRELWQTDGSTISQVKDIYPGAPNGVLAGTLRARTGTNEVVFGATDGNDGLQVWVSDGTALGTHQVGKIGPWAGSGAVELGEFTTLGADTWFWCDDGITGREPWRISITGVVASVSTYGLGCAGTGNLVPAASAVGLPRLGNSGFALRGSNGLPLALSIYFLSSLPSNVPIGTCQVLIGQPLLSMPAALTDPFGTALSALPIPLSPVFAGVTFYGQWLVLDGNGALLGLGALSNGLSFTIGN